MTSSVRFIQIGPPKTLIREISNYTLVLFANNYPVAAKFETRTRKKRNIPLAEFIIVMQRSVIDTANLKSMVVSEMIRMFTAQPNH